MKRFFLATSLIALTMGSVAFAQSGSGSMGNSPAMSGSGASTQNTNSGGMNGAGSMGTTDSGMNGSSANGGMAARGSHHASASASNVRHAQQALKSDGMYQGRIDGKWGPETRHAVAQFQKEKGLKQTAQLDEPTMNDLQNGGMSSSGNMSSGPSSSGAMNNGMNRGGDARAGAPSASSLVPASPTTMPKTNPGPTQPAN